jgi:transposase
LAQLTGTLAHEILGALDDIWETCFKNQEREPYPYAVWERERQKVKHRLQELPRLVQLAAEKVKVVKDSRGQHTAVPIAKRVMLLIFKRLTERSNRGMEDLLTAFEPLFEFQRSYKFIERLYSDLEVRLVLHNLFILMVREEGVSGHYAGDGTGYALTIEQHYRKAPQKRGKKYALLFFIIDIETNFYVGYGHSHISEMDAFHKACAVLRELRIPVESMRLDKYYSSRKVIRLFSREVSLYLIPKKNIARFGAQWPAIFQKILDDPIAFLHEYFYRNLCETSNSTDKNRFGNYIHQQRIERQETETKCLAVLHNIFATRVKQSSSMS